MRRLFSSNPNKLDPLEGPGQITPEMARKIGHFIETSNDPFADFFVKPAKRIVEQETRAQKPASSRHRPRTMRSIRPRLSY